MNSYIIWGMLLSGSLLAQQATSPSPPPIETPAAAPAVTNAPAAALSESPSTNAVPKKKATGKKKPQKKSTAKKKAAGAELKTVPLVPGPATVDANHVNVRGQARLNSEIVARLAKDQKVTVIQEITKNNSGPDEPSAWAKIVLPSDVHVWINSGFIDASNKTVKPKKLNVRSGPGENFSVLGRLERGEPVNQVGSKGDWLEIEAPTNSYAFVAAQYLKQEAPAPAAPVEPAPVSATVTNEAAIAATAPTENPAAPSSPTAANTNVPVEPTASEPAAAAPEEPPKRIVEREGIVRGTFSIQAPTHFELISPENKRTIDYLYTTSPNLDLRRYKGLRIIVTGEEGLEERWGNTPVITIQKIQVVE
jgi:uncharacterized protein YgiM (DUF1202 family)